MADGCGFVDRSFLKTGGDGTSVKVGGWPWIALLGYDDGVSTSTFKCGGALITSRHVLTAAHCMRQDLTFVRLGEHDLNSETETTHVDIPIAKRLRHPQYNEVNGHNDIALLYLSQNVQFSDRITPICIPFEPQLRSKDITGYHPYVAGWGKTMEGGVSSNIIRELLIPIYSNADCKELYRKHGNLIFEEQFDNTSLCAGNSYKSGHICEADSGGPLMLPETYEKKSIHFHLIGIESYGIDCGTAGVPGVFTRVTNFIEWIENGVADTAFNHNA